MELFCTKPPKIIRCATCIIVDICVFAVQSTQYCTQTCQGNEIINVFTNCRLTFQLWRLKCHLQLSLQWDHFMASQIHQQLYWVFFFNNLLGYQLKKT